jgi:hypothetical protein
VLNVADYLNVIQYVVMLSVVMLMQNVVMASVVAPESHLKLHLSSSLTFQIIYPPKNKNSRYNPVLPGMGESGTTDPTTTNQNAVTASA